ncbi:MAG TPA: hypothetical protein VK357_14100 [Rubrobacteraceae bacterium]|nr:hypothetical protein [Rubrobacteraceae bacterium]
MKRVFYLLTVALVAMLILVPAAMAQEMEAEVKTEQTMMMEETMMDKGKDLPKSGGVTLGSVILPAGALLLGGGILAVAVLRRR